MVAHRVTNLPSVGQPVGAILTRASGRKSSSTTHTPIFAQTSCLRVWAATAGFGTGNGSVRTGIPKTEMMVAVGVYALRGSLAPDGRTAVVPDLWAEAEKETSKAAITVMPHRRIFIPQCCHTEVCSRTRIHEFTDHCRKQTALALRTPVSERYRDVATTTPGWAMEWERSNCTQSTKNTIIKTQVAKCNHGR